MTKKNFNRNTKTDAQINLNSKSNNYTNKNNNENSNVEEKKIIKSTGSNKSIHGGHIRKNVIDKTWDPEYDNKKNTISCKQKNKNIDIINSNIGNDCIITIIGGTQHCGTIISFKNESLRYFTNIDTGMNLKKNEKKTLSNCRGKVKMTVSLNDVLEILPCKNKNKISNMTNLPDKNYDNIPKHENKVDKVKKNVNEEKKNNVFKIDSEILNNSTYKKRELDKWVPNSDLENFDIYLDNVSLDSYKNWDQFKMNKEKFGIESSYSELLYTTEIDTNAPDYKIKLANAEKSVIEIKNTIVKNRKSQRKCLIGQNQHNNETRNKNDVDKTVKAVKNSNKPINLKILTKKVTFKQKSTQPQKNISTSCNSLNKSIISNSQFKQPISKSCSNKTQSINNKLLISKVNITDKVNDATGHDILKEEVKKKKVLQDNSTKPTVKSLYEKTKSSKTVKKKETENTNTTISNDENILQHDNSEQNKPSFKPNIKAAIFIPFNNLNYEQVTLKNNFKNHVSSLNSNNLNSFRDRSNSVPSVSKMNKNQLSSNNFFFPKNNVPTLEAQKSKIKNFDTSFNLFITYRKKKDKKKDKNLSNVCEKTYWTPPTWDYTIDESYEKFFLLFDSDEKINPNISNNFFKVLKPEIFPFQDPSLDFFTPYHQHFFNNDNQMMINPKQQQSQSPSFFQQLFQNYFLQRYSQFPFLYNPDSSFFLPAGFMTPPNYIFNGNISNPNVTLRNNNTQHSNQNNHLNSNLFLHNRKSIHDSNQCNSKKNNWCWDIS